MVAKISPAQNVAPLVSEAPLITVAICTRNRAIQLRQAVESVLTQWHEESELLVIDNASTDETPAMARAAAQSFPQVRILREAELGLSAARNTALREARGQYVIFLDDDAIAEPGWLAAYREVVLHPPTPDLAGMGGTVFPRYDVPTPWWLDPLANTLNWSEQPQEFRGRGHAWGCNFAVRRQLALKVGGFNPLLGRKGGAMGAHEESELLERIQQAGGRLWWVPQARIRHHVASHRLTLRANCRGEFCQGRSSALYRFRRGAGQKPRKAYRLGRALFTPFHCGICLLGTVAMFLIGRPMLGVQYIFRAARNAGFGWQTAWDLFRGAPPADSSGVRS
jgi:GT2 family glycosyltransferase